MEEKLISIIIPCYNVESYIDRCIRSLVRQTIGIEKLMLICVDDASEDRTFERLMVWEKRFPQSILLLRLEKNSKQGAARNAGMQYVSTPYVGYVDSDDWAEEDMFEKLYEKAEANQCNMTCCRFVRDTGNVQFDKKTGQPDQHIFITSTEDRKRYMLLGKIGGVWCRLFQKRFLDETGAAFPEGLTYEDNYFIAVVNMHLKSVYIIEEVLYHYFVNTESTVLKKDSPHHFDRMQIEMMKLELYREMGVFEPYKDVIEYQFIKHYYLNTMNLLLLRFSDAPLHVYEALKRTVRDQFPGYKENPYLGRLHEVEQAVLMTMDREYDEEGFYAFAMRYKKLFDNN